MIVLFGNVKGTVFIYYFLPLGPSGRMGTVIICFCPSVRLGTYWLCTSSLGWNLKILSIKCRWEVYWLWSLKENSCNQPIQEVCMPSTWYHQHNNYSIILGGGYLKDTISHFLTLKNYWVDNATRQSERPGSPSLLRRIAGYMSQNNSSQFNLHSNRNISEIKLS